MSKPSTTAPFKAVRIGEPKPRYQQKVILVGKCIYCQQEYKLGFRNHWKQCIANSKRKG